MTFFQFKLSLTKDLKGVDIYTPTGVCLFHSNSVHIYGFACAAPIPRQVNEWYNQDLVQLPSAASPYSFALTI